MDLGPLYHWVPADRAEAIALEGLRPGQPSTVASEPLPHICLGLDPQSAWAISGAVGWHDVAVWDLWLVRLADDDPVTVRPEFGPRIREVTVAGLIPPERVWRVGRRDWA